MKKLTYLAIIALSVSNAAAQDSTGWNGRKCAIVLTYDDALNVHLSNAIPALDSFGLKGTFYLSDYFGGLRRQVDGWRKAAANGHELGNHTVYHPCEGGRPGREFVRPDYDLARYSTQRIVDEASTMNTILYAIDGRSERTFAFPCGDTKVKDSLYAHSMKKDFLAFRGVHADLPQLKRLNFDDLPCHMVNGQTGAQLIAWVKEAQQKGSLLVLLFHGVGGDHGLDVSLPAHRELLHYLKANQSSIWVAPMIDVVKWAKGHQQQQTP